MILVLRQEIVKYLLTLDIIIHIKPIETIWIMTN